MPADLNHGVIAREKLRLGAIWGDRVGRRVVKAARELAPIDTGALRTSIEYVMDVRGDRVHVVIGSPLPYARYLHEGTGIHGPHGTPIVPLRAESPSGGPAALKFKPSGAGLGVALAAGNRKFVFARSVQGIRPNPFLVKALRAVMVQIEELR